MFGTWLVLDFVGEHHANDGRVKDFEACENLEARCAGISSAVRIIALKTPWPKVRN